ncbi:hypothetical protein GCM10010275_10750 [Streptomyces litmocidini]|uniref:hypothetical protein n=1 Tax=Streptomyces litmocidini TaxID=67318 RepID=UPI00167D0E90|nr:hypothetical protein [Streptomyces litmocidini]GGU77947.1 hypothetical protein GCM10010275_10750 [Streptomyces litmocidini]
MTPLPELPGPFDVPESPAVPEPANSTYVRPKPFATVSPCPTWNSLVAAMSVVPRRSTTRSTRPVAGPVSLFSEDANFQIVPSGARTTPP